MLSGANLQGSEGNWIGLIRKLECDIITTQASGKSHEDLRSKDKWSLYPDISQYLDMVWVREQDKISGKAAYFQGSSQGRTYLWAHRNHHSWKGTMSTLVLKRAPGTLYAPVATTWGHFLMITTSFEMLENIGLCSVAKSCPVLCDPMDCSINRFLNVAYFTEKCFEIMRHIISNIWIALKFTMQFLHISSCLINYSKTESGITEHHCLLLPLQRLRKCYSWTLGISGKQKL